MAGWGGYREGAGRPRGPGRPRNWVRARPAHDRAHPVHITMWPARELCPLRRPAAYEAVRIALECTLVREDFRVVHASIQREHLELIVEADDTLALSRGMQSFQSSAARRLNSASDRLGPVFTERYKADVLTTRPQTRNAIERVLNGWRLAADASGAAPVDLYASGCFFDGWKDGGPFPLPAGHLPLPVALPDTELLTTGWRRYGLIDPFAIPER